MDFDGLPGIDDYLIQSNKKDITTTGCEDIIDKLVSEFGISKDQASTIFCLFFEELRSEIVKENTVFISKFGTIGSGLSPFVFKVTDLFKKELNEE
jgi:hypothetical protein